jgi:hypothetical protein
MSDGEFLDDRRRASEDDYFRRKDKELIDRMRRAAAEDKNRNELSAKTGLTDPALVKELEALGFSPDTITVLPLVPIVQMAWAEGGVSAAERSLLVTLARERGIKEGSAADRLLSDWMSHEPSPEVFARATRLIRAMLDTGAADTTSMSADEVIKYADNIAHASGGILGIGRMSGEERTLLAKIVTALKGRK